MMFEMFARQRRRIFVIIIVFGILMLLYFAFLSKWSFFTPFSQEVPHGNLTYYLKYGVQYLLNPLRLCEHTEKLSVLIIVPSKRNHFEQRKTIRETWASYKTPSARVGFLLGTGKGSLDESIRNEHHQHNDVIQANFLDTYENLTLKSLVMMHWTLAHCPQAKYLIKCDDDVYVDISKLALFLRSKQNTNEIIGRFNYKFDVVRNKSSKWYVPESVYPEAQFPDYLQGPSYIMPTSVLPQLFGLCAYYAHIPIEDAVVTGLCAKQVGIERTEDSHFTIDALTMSLECGEDIITRKHVSSKRMRYYHHQLSFVCNSSDVDNSSHLGD